MGNEDHEDVAVPAVPSDRRDDGSDDQRGAGDQGGPGGAVDVAGADPTPFMIRLLETMAERAPTPIVATDRHGSIIQVNRTFLEVFNLAREEALDRPLVDLFGADSPLVAALDLDGGRTSGSTVVGANVEHRGEARPFLVTRFAVADEEGALEAVGLILIDLAFRQRAASAIRRYDEVRQRQQQAEAASRAKSEFLSRMSHELRTPLNSIVGFTQVLARSDELDRSQRELVDLIERAGRHLVRLINDVLDVAGIEAGKLTLSIEPVNVHDAVAEAIGLVSVIADANDVTLSHVSGPGSSWVRADRQRLIQILLNLLSNAIRYNHRGGAVTVTTELVDDHVRIAVADTGSGIPPELLPRVFEPFERLGAEQRGIEGSGIGLSVSKGLAEQMDGRLTATSVVQAGSTFTLELPSAAEQRVAGPAGPTAPHRAGGGPAIRILYIEDNSANLTLMELALAQRSGITLLSARTGQGGLAMLATEAVDLVMVDLHLPDIDGTEVLRRIRQDEATAELPVVIISADAMSERIEQLRAEGADYYLTKPIDLNELYATVDEVRTTRGSHRA